ncbi:MAG: iron-sulfur cluster-binding protein [SAR324 cluster bacterium]|nr:iron-sulfur cluster-binding protein [SAR324 cluster bacterium]
MQLDAKQFKRDRAAALENKPLRRNLERAMTTIRGRRNERFSQFVDGEALQWIGHAIKRNALANLPDLLEQLEEQLTSRGIQVHWAETTGDANRIVKDIAKRRGVGLVIKGKSMVSEEMELNDYLAGHGIEALEADLGEFIVQLAGEPPSHLVAPAVHLSRQEIAVLFHDELGEEYTEDIQAMTALARRVLREKFQQAGMGVTGVNFAVAETGTIALVENEGNGRMCTTVPPVHVALMGIEKVIPRLDEMSPLIRSLTASATGQPISTYFNWLSSPRRPGEKDGPEEVHLVILDNGRSSIYADEELRETLDCIRCGACLNICPVYSRIGGHAYSTVYMGPIGKILTPQLAGLEKGGHLAGASTLCGACYEVCPVKIPIPDLLLRLRREGVQPTPAGIATLKGAGAKASLGEAMVWKGWRVVHNRPALYKLMTRLLGFAGRTLPKRMGPLREWSATRDLPKAANRSLHHLLRDRSNAWEAGKIRSDSE